MDFVDTGEALGPVTARAAVDPVGAWGVGYVAVEVGFGAGVEFARVGTPVPRHLLRHFAFGAKTP